jgi:CDP-glucose 4,6-dehydratase
MPSVESFRHYKGKRVLITGHTGFKGSWLTIWLKMLGAHVYGYALPAEERSLYRSAGISSMLEDERMNDLGLDNSLKKFVESIDPDVVFHLAAEAIVAKAHRDPVNAWQTNVVGTLKLMQVLKGLNRECRLVVITSDKCYENNEWVWGYRENDSLGGKDMYSASKAAVEMLVRAFFRSYLEEDGSLLFVATARAGNVIGGGDWSEYRLVPDCMRSWMEGQAVQLRSPNSTRPWQHVLEPLRGYLQLGYALSVEKATNGQAFNFGPDAAESKDVSELVNELSKYWKEVQWAPASDQERFAECSMLALNCDKSAAWLKWRPALSFAETARMTAEWYFANSQGEDARELSMKQISEYQDLL